MGRARTYSGKLLQGHDPDWRPLLKTVGEEVAGDFMWMFEVELSTGKPVHAYKHIDTRCYVHLDHDGTAFAYVEPDRYRAFPVAKVLAAVFAPMVGLAGVTDEQIRASWAAVDRLRDRGPAGSNPARREPISSPSTDGELGT